MPQITTITVNDGATPAVSHVFAIQDRDGGKTTFRDSYGSTVRGSCIFSHDAVLGKSPRVANRNILSLKMPLEATNNGVVSVVKESSAKVEINFAPDATSAERTAMIGLLINLLNNADVKANVIAISPSS